MRDPRTHQVEYVAGDPKFVIEGTDCSDGIVVEVGDQARPRVELRIAGPVSPVKETEGEGVTFHPLSLSRLRTPHRGHRSCDSPLQCGHTRRGWPRRGCDRSRRPVRSLAAGVTEPSGTPHCPVGSMVVRSVLELIASVLEAAISHIAVPWLLNRKPLVMPVPGTTNRAHLLENLDTQDVQPSRDEIQAVDGIAREVARWTAGKHPSELRPECLARCRPGLPPCRYFRAYRKVDTGIADRLLAVIW